MPKSKLLAQGSYGCVYHPGYSCTTDTQTTKYVSKLSRDDKPTQVEYNMGKLVKKIPNYDKRFIVIEKKCKIKRSKVEKLKEGCEFIQKREYPSYVLLYSRYLKSVELSTVLSDTTISYYRLIQITHTIYKRISELYSVGIIHMDLHFGNILVSKKNGRIYVIDFGLALDKNRFFIENRLNMSYIHEKWFDYKTDWPSWSLDYIFISLIVREHQSLTKINILDTITHYYNEKKNVLGDYLDKTYIQVAFDYYKSFEKNSSEENIKLLLEYNHTWDDYKLAYHILSYMRRKSIDFIEFKWLLLLMMHPLPHLRPTQEELKEHFHNYLELFKEYETFKIHKDEDSVVLKAELSKSVL